MCIMGILEINERKEPEVILEAINIEKFPKVVTDKIRESPKDTKQDKCPRLHLGISYSQLEKEKILKSQREKNHFSYRGTETKTFKI